MAAPQSRFLLIQKREKKAKGDVGIEDIFKKIIESNISNGILKDANKLHQ